MSPYSGILSLVISALFVFAFVVGLIGIGYRRFAAGYPAAREGLGVLHRGEVAFVRSTAEVMFPSKVGLAVTGLEAQLPLYVDRHLAALPRAQRWQIRALFVLCEHGTLLLPARSPGGRSRFSSLSAASRVSVLEQMSGHPHALVRLVFTALRGVLVLGYLGHPANLDALGLSPFEIEPAVSDAELLFPRVGGLVSSIEYEESDRTDGAVHLEERRPLDPENGARHPAYARSVRRAR
ncbi:MAG: hypothetical protein AB8G23_22675 [Myxococcota bacterium]